ncbi:MAG: sensor histidine kinase [Ruminococcus sp.]|nr:sensor histidine kinase [Ruminococcus sp.]
MYRIADKVMILLLCFVMFCFSKSDGAYPVVGTLLSAASASLVSLYPGTAVAYVDILLFSALCIPFPELMCALPILLYDAAGEKKIWLAAPAVIALARLPSLNKTQMILIPVLSAAALLYRLRVGSLEKSLRTYSRMRDTVEEKNVQLADTNIRLAEAQDNEVHLATLRERNRIAREIHDNVGHMLTRSLLQAGALMIINKDEKLKEPLAELKDTLNTAMTSIRESVHDLHDESIDLDAAVRESIRNIGSRFKVSYENDSDGDLPVKIRLCFIAVIKEALSNAVKHSDGDSIHIIIRQHPAFYQLMIEDNGCCGDKPVISEGIGLQNMSDRAAAVGGNITFTPSREGFKVFMTVKA